MVASVFLVSRVNDSLRTEKVRKLKDQAAPCWFQVREPDVCLVDQDRRQLVRSLCETMCQSISLDRNARLGGETMPGSASGDERDLNMLRLTE